METKLINKRNIGKRKLFLAFFAVVLVAAFFIWKKDVRVKGSLSQKLPVLVMIDSGKRIVESTSTDASKILAENNIEVFPEDQVSTELILDPVAEGGAGQKITVVRAPKIVVTADGEETVYRSWKKTIEEVIKEKGFPLAPKDIITPDLNTQVGNGVYVTVTRVTEQDVDVFEDIAFETKYTTSASVAFGQKSVTQEGKKGQLKKTFKITYKDGKEVSRRLKSTETTVKKQDKIIATGVITGRANFGYYSGMVTSFYKGMTGKYLLVTNLANGKQVKVRIIGSGPFNGPLMDMGTEPFQAIGGRLSDGYIPKVSVSLVD